MIDGLTLDAARRTGHNLIDARLMMAWAQSLHDVGETDKARAVQKSLEPVRKALKIPANTKYGRAETITAMTAVTIIYRPFGSF